MSGHVLHLLCITDGDTAHVKVFQTLKTLQIFSPQESECEWYVLIHSHFESLHPLSASSSFPHLFRVTTAPFPTNCR